MHNDIIILSVFDENIFWIKNMFLG